MVNSVIASEAKQSRAKKSSLDCFVASAFALRASAAESLLAMTTERVLMKIPRLRQDAHVAGMADALGGIVGMLAAVVVERLDQGGARRQRMLAFKGIVGQADQVVRAVDQPLRRPDA